MQRPSCTGAVRRAALTAILLLAGGCAGTPSYYDSVAASGGVRSVYAFTGSAAPLASYADASGHEIFPTTDGRLFYSESDRRGYLSRVADARLERAFQRGVELDPADSFALGSEARQIDRERELLLQERERILRRSQILGTRLATETDPARRGRIEAERGRLLTERRSLERRAEQSYQRDVANLERRHRQFEAEAAARARRGGPFAPSTPLRRNRGRLGSRAALSGVPDAAPGTAAAIFGRP